MNLSDLLVGSLEFSCCREVTSAISFDQAEKGSLKRDEMLFRNKINYALKRSNTIQYNTIFKLFLVEKVKK